MIKEQYLTPGARLTPPASPGMVALAAAPTFARRDPERTLTRHLRSFLAVALAGVLTAAAAWAQPAPAPADLPLAATPAAVAAVPVAVAAPGPAPEFAVVQLSAAARATASTVSGYAVDPSGARSSSDPQQSSRLSLRADLDTGERWGPWSVKGRLGGDVATGTFAGKPTLQGDQLPGSRFDNALVTDAWAGIALKNLLEVRAGVMASHWGMGLIAHDGGQAFDARRNDWFSLPTLVDRVARAMLIVQPFGRQASSLRGLILAAAADRVIEDPTGSRAANDTANQGLFAARWYAAHNQWAGLYYVYRDQTYATGRFLHAHVIDATFDFDFSHDGHGLRLQGEGAAILGTTSLAPTADFAQHDVRQGAFVGRARYDMRPIRFELDAGWLSGDDQLDNGSLSAFKANPNYQQGILLFSQVLATQSGRARGTASNLQYMGQPAQDLDHLATGGSVTSAVTVFPKMGWKCSDLLEVYGGALFAFAPAIPIDPFTTTTSGGGQPRNFLGKAPTSSQLGTEIDLGVATTLATTLPLLLQVRAEYAVLLPGGALTGLDSPIHGGRLTLALVPPVH